jgi:hypothetical protein
MKYPTNYVKVLVFITGLMVGILGGATTGKVTGVAGAFSRAAIKQHTIAFAKSATWRISPVKAGHPAEAFSPSIQVDPTPDGINNGQRNLLVAWVDSLHADNPRLEGLWLVLFVPNSPSLTWLPLYPEGLIESIDGNPQWYADFRLKPDGEIDSQFVANLRSKDVWWNNYLVIDETGLVEIVNRSLNVNGSPAITPQPDAGDRIIGNMPLAWEDPGEALKAQFDLLDSLCLSIPAPNQPAGPADLLGLLDHHLVTNLQAEEILSIRNNLRLTGGRLCKFPTRRLPNNSLEQP